MANALREKVPPLPQPLFVLGRLSLSLSPLVPLPSPTPPPSLTNPPTPCSPRCVPFYSKSIWAHIRQSRPDSVLGCKVEVLSCSLFAWTRGPRYGSRAGSWPTPSARRSYLTESVYKVVLQKSIPAKIRQLMLYISDYKGYVDGFVRQLAFAKRLYKHFL